VSRREKGPGVILIVESSSAANPAPASREFNSDTQSQKVCRRCGEARPRELFRSQPRHRDGLGSWCKPCALDRTQQWRGEHRESLNARRREQYAAVRGGPVRPYTRPAARQGGIGSRANTYDAPNPAPAFCTPIRDSVSPEAML